MPDGWLRTGDLGRLDAAGHLVLVGRSKNMIVTAGGKNVYPEDVEAALGAVPCEELCVFSEGFLWPGKGLGQDRLTVVVRPKKRQRPQALLGKLREVNHDLRDYKRLASYVLWDDEFPRTSSMKVKRDRLAEQVRRERDRGDELLETVAGEGVCLPS